MSAKSKQSKILSLIRVLILIVPRESSPIGQCKFMTTNTISSLKVQDSHHNALRSMCSSCTPQLLDILEFLDDSL